MKILVINSGSSSLKFQVVDPENEKALAKGVCERIGIDGIFNYRTDGGISLKEPVDMPDKETMTAVIEKHIGSTECFCYDKQMAGFAAQEHIAEFKDGKVPVQLFGDFCENRVSTALGEVTPSICGEWTFANLREVLPTFIGDSLVEGIRASERKIHGFSRPDAVLSGVEARTSSPVRIVRNETLESPSLTGLYPCGEGAGYAGGITSAAMDGLKTAEEIAKKYMNFS